jgi:hypothetical protein
LPLRTNKFTKDVSVFSLTRDGTIITAACDEQHGLKPGDVAVIVGSFVPIAATDLTRTGTVGQVILATRHDLTPTANDSVILSGSNESEFNGTFQIIGIADDKTITFEMVDSGPTIATGSPILENGESALRQYDGAYEVLEVPSDSSFTFTNSVTSLADPIGTIIARVKPRISAAATADRIIQVYTEQKTDDFWMFVVLEDVVASKSRRIQSDAVDNLTLSTEFRQQVIQPFSIYVLIPTADSVSGRGARDDAEDLFRSICQAILFMQFPSGLYASELGAVQFVSHGTFNYDTAVYVHAYGFQQVVDLYFEDTVGPDLDVAFRTIDLTMTPIIPGGGTGVETLTATPELDEPNS